MSVQTKKKDKTYFLIICKSVNLPLACPLYSLFGEGNCSPLDTVDVPLLIPTDVVGLVTGVAVLFVSAANTGLLRCSVGEVGSTHWTRNVVECAGQSRTINNTVIFFYN